MLEGDDGLNAATRSIISSAEAVTAVSADDEVEDVDGSVLVEKGSEPTGLVGSNNILSTFLRRCVLSNRTFRWVSSGLSADDVTLVRLNIVQITTKLFIFNDSRM